MPWYNMSIDWRGDTSFCCFETRHYHGNIFENGFFDIWNGKKAIALRKSIRERRRSTLCKTCTMDDGSGFLAKFSAKHRKTAYKYIFKH